MARRLWSDLIRVGIDEEEVGKQVKGGGAAVPPPLYVALDIIEARRAEAGGLRDRTATATRLGEGHGVPGCDLRRGRRAGGLAPRAGLARVAAASADGDEWREVRDQTTWAPERFTSAVYQQVMAGKPRLAGARSALEYFGVPDVEARAERYAAAKQEQIVRLIEEGRFMAFPDALRFILAVKAAGIRVAAASSSKNAKLFLARIRLDTFAAEQRLDYDFIGPRMTLGGPVRRRHLGPGLPQGKPDPAIFLTAAQELGIRPADALVVEDATSGVQAAKAGRMAAIGVARLDDRDLLVEAGADLVVPTLDDVALTALVEGRLEERRAVAELRQRHTERPASVWRLVYDGFDPARQGLREALCAVGNGYFVTRGALPEAGADEVHYPGTYVAGLYNRARTEIAGRTVENEDLVNVPNWLPLSFRVADGPWFDVQQAGVLDHRLELDLRQGTLTRYLRWQDPDGRRTSVVQRRLVSLKDQHLAGLETTFTAENWSGTILVRSGLDGRVVNAGVKRYRDLNGRHLAVLHAGEADAETIELQVETNQSHVRVALAARTRLLRRRPGRPGRPAAGLRARVRRPRADVRAPGGAAGDGGEGGRPLHLPGPSHLREPAGRAPGGPGGGGLRRAAGPARGHLEDPLEPVRHQLDSANEWTETILHLHIFHLLQTVSPHTEHLDVGVPARGWHGGGLPGPHLLGRAVHLPVLQPPAAEGGGRAAGLPARPPRRGPGGGPAGRLPGGHVPLAERLQRARGDPAAAPQPQVGPLAARPLPAAAARQHRHRLQRLAALPDHRRQRVPALRRRRVADRDRPVLGQPRHLERQGRPLRDPRGDGPGRVPRGLPRRRPAGAEQQHLHQRDGGVGAAAGPGVAGGPAAPLPPGAGRRAGDP